MMDEVLPGPSLLSRSPAGPSGGNRYSQACRVQSNGKPTEKSQALPPSSSNLVSLLVMFLNEHVAVFAVSRVRNPARTFLSYFPVSYPNKSRPAVVVLDISPGSVRAGSGAYSTYQGSRLFVVPVVFFYHPIWTPSTPSR